MREIKFRGISERTGKFVFGSYFNADTGHTIIENGGSDMKDFHFVNKETISELTGSKDKNRVEIYENDKVKYNKQIKKVTFHAGRWGLANLDEKTCAGAEIGKHYDLYLNTEEVEVIGTIHQLTPHN